MQILEREVISKVMKYCKKHNITLIRMTFMAGSRAGWPDYMFLLEGGRPLFIEFKGTGKKPSELQKYRLKKLTELGYTAIVCDNPEDAIAAIEKGIE